MTREPFVSAIYKSELDATNQPTENFADHVNKVVNKAQAVRHRKKQYGSYSSKGARATPESTRLTRRITGEKDD